MAPNTEHDVATIRSLMSDGDLHAAGELIHDAMNEGAGGPDVETLLAYSEYLLLKCRPFSAESALHPIEDQGSQRQELLSARAALARSDQSVEPINPSASDRALSGKVNTTLLDGLDPERIREARAAQSANFERHLRVKPFLNDNQSYLPGVLGTVDERLQSLVQAGRPTAEGPPALWAYFLGETLRHLAGAEWRGGGLVADSTMKMPNGLEFSPYVWAFWRLNHRTHSLVGLVSVLMRLDGADDQAIKATLGSTSPLFPEGRYEPHWGRHALSEALHYALDPDCDVVGVGLTAECPISRMQVPLLVGGPSGVELVLFWNTSEEEEQFRRFVDMLCLSEYGKTRWQIVSPHDIPSDLALYGQADGARRAVLCARRFLTPNPKQNARWCVTLLDHLMDIVLDGSLESIELLDGPFMDNLRRGGPQRWASLFGDRHSLLVMVTSYIGETLIRHVGGSWGVDRITGEPFGPTSGLEAGDVRFNLGAKVLKRFYSEESVSILPVVRDYQRRVTT